jgi:hypothetical protein
MADFTWTLSKDGPEPEDPSWINGKTLQINNKFSQAIVVTLPHTATLIVSQGNQVTVNPGDNGWSGRIGAANQGGGYDYTDPEGAQAPRSGTISIG